MRLTGRAKHFPIGWRLAPTRFTDVILECELRGDQRLAVEAGSLWVICQRMEHSAIEFRRLRLLNELPILIRTLLHCGCRTLRELRTQPERHGCHVIWRKVHAHIRSELVESGLLCPVGRSVHVAACAEGRS